MSGGAETFARARALLGRQVRVTLSREDTPEGVVIARGQLLRIADSGEFVVCDDMSFCHYCWPMLDIEEDRESARPPEEPK